MMRSSFVAALLFFVALPLASVSAQHHHHSGSACGCGAPAPAPVPCTTCDPCNTCNPCDTCGTDACGCSTCGSLCNNPALFYEVLYSEFYARNAWYVEYRARESAARRARLYGQDPDAATPPPYSPGPIKAPAKPVNKKTPAKVNKAAAVK